MVITYQFRNPALKPFAQVMRQPRDTRAINDDRLELRVTDYVCGIPEDDRFRVFEPFYTTKRGRGGTGLGLHLVYTLVTARLAGQVELTSSDDGTSVAISIPCSPK